MRIDELSSFVYLAAALSLALCVWSWALHRVEYMRAQTMYKRAPLEEHVGPIPAGILTGIVQSSITLCGYVLMFYSRGDFYWLWLGILIGIFVAEAGIPVEKNAPSKKEYGIFILASFATSLVALASFCQMAGLPMAMAGWAASFIAASSFVLLQLLNAAPEITFLRWHW